MGKNRADASDMDALVAPTDNVGPADFPDPPQGIDDIISSDADEED